MPLKADIPRKTKEKTKEKRPALSRITMAFSFKCPNCPTGHISAATCDTCFFFSQEAFAALQAHIQRDVYSGIPQPTFPTESFAPPTFAMPASQAYEMPQPYPQPAATQPMTQESIAAAAAAEQARHDIAMSFLVSNCSNCRSNPCTCGHRTYTSYSSVGRF